MILDLGCGTEKAPGAIGVDRHPRADADVRADLAATHLPFRASCADVVIMSHVLEHVEDVEALLREVHRLAKPSGEIRLRLPHFSSVYAFTDFTHRHFFTSRSFDRFDATSTASPYDLHIFGTDLQFTIIERRISFEAVFQAIHVGRWRGIPLHKLTGLEWLINHAGLDAYEKRFAFLLPASELRIRMHAVKPA